MTASNQLICFPVWPLPETAMEGWNISRLPTGDILYITRTDDLYDLFPVQDVDLPGGADVFLIIVWPSLCCRMGTV